MLASQEHNKVRITSETLIGPNDKGEDVQVSAEKNNSTARVQYRRNNQK